MNKIDERELNLVDMFWAVCQKWRVFVVWALVFAVAFGIFGYYRSTKSVDADKLEEKLSDDDKLYIDMYLTYESFCRIQKDYNTYSPLMRLQPNNYYTDVMVFYVDNHYTVEYPVIDESNNISALVQAYKTVLVKEEVLDKIVAELDLPAKSKAYAAEYIDLNNYYSNAVIQNSGNLIILSVYGNTSAECEKLSAIVLEAIETEKPQITEKFGEHDISLVSESVKRASDIDLSTYQKKNIDNLYSYNTSLTASEGNLSNAALDYVDVVKPVDDDEEEKPVEASPLSIKLIVIGFILGAVIVLLFEALGYVINRELRFEDDFEAVFGIKLLGARANPAPANGKWFGFIDRWLIRKRRRHMHILSEEDMLSMVTSNIRLLARKNDITGIYLTGVSIDEIPDDMLDNISKRLEKDGVALKQGKPFIYSAQALEEAEKTGCIIIAEKPGQVSYSELYNMLDTCEAMKIKVLGGIIAE